MEQFALKHFILFSLICFVTMSFNPLQYEHLEDYYEAIGNRAICKCIIHQNCECGDSSRQKFEKCWNTLAEASKTGFIEYVNDNCENFDDNLPIAPISEWTPEFCAKEKDIERSCLFNNFGLLKDKIRYALFGDYGPEIENSTINFYIWRADNYY